LRSEPGRKALIAQPDLSLSNEKNKQLAIGNGCRAAASGRSDARPVHGGTGQQHRAKWHGVPRSPSSAPARCI